MGKQARVYSNAGKGKYKERSKSDAQSVLRTSQRLEASEGPVLTKKDFVRRYEMGEFGNKSPTWNTLQEFLKTKLQRTDKLVHIRNRVAGGPTWYDITANCVELWTQRIVDSGKAKLNDLYFSLMAPTHLTLIQGEVQQSCQHLDLYYSMVKLPMRQSLIEGGKQVSGLRAKLILELYLDTPSLEWLNYLLQSYHAHVIEFSTYQRRWGTHNWNTVFWEVRGGY